jgi:hypothetical protein
VRGSIPRRPVRRIVSGVEGVAGQQLPQALGHAIGSAIDRQSIGDITKDHVCRALEGVYVDLDGKKIGKLLFGSKPPTDTGSSFDSRLSPTYPTGGL